MADSLFSPSWYRVADLKPRLRSHAEIHRHSYRDEVWYVLQDHLSGTFHRFSEGANRIIGLMDGERTVDRIWQLATAELGDDHDWTGWTAPEAVVPAVVFLATPAGTDYTGKIVDSTQYGQTWP